MAGCLLVMLAVTGAQGQDFDSDTARTTAQVRIGLPAGEAPLVSLSPGVDRVAIELPRGSRFPDDFAAATNGLLQAGTVENVGSRVKLDLELGSGVLERVDYEAEAVVLHFHSRLGVVDAFVDPEERYLLGPDDRIKVSVHNHEDLSGVRIIDRDGLITEGFVGEVRASGLTTRQLAAKLTERLSAFIVDPKVDIDVEEYRSQWVMVSGEFNRLGRVRLRGGTRLKEVVGEAEGFTDYAGEQITVSRKVAGTDRTVTMTVERSDFEIGKENPSLQHGDIVEVKRADFCYIQGEVRESSRVRIERGMTLLRVISLAGGLTDWADKKNVKVRYPEGTVPRERVFNIKRILNNREEDPLMRGGEVIFVPKRFL